MGRCALLSFEQPPSHPVLPFPRPGTGLLFSHARYAVIGLGDAQELIAGIHVWDGLGFFARIRCQLLPMLWVFKFACHRDNISLSLKQPPSLSVRLAPGPRLDLAPIPALARAGGSG